MNLTLGITRGLTSAGRASPIWAGWMERNHFRPGQFNYPTRNFATLGPL